MRNCGSCFFEMKWRLQCPAQFHAPYSFQSYGLESSLIAFLLCMTTGVVLLIMAIQRGNIGPPFWKRERAGQASQSSQRRPSMRAKSPSPVTTMRPRLREWPAIIRS